MTNKKFRAIANELEEQIQRIWYLRQVMHLIANDIDEQQWLDVYCRLDDIQYALECALEEYL